MYNKETLRKLMERARELKNQYLKKDIMDIAICISKGNRKIGRVMNVSLMPIMTCANCNECKYFRYDVKACVQYPHNVLDARIRNTVLATQNMPEYFNRIRWAIKRRKKNKFFRWHVAGDILNKEYFAEMVAIAKEFPEFIFWTYTKNYSIVNSFCDEFGRDAIPGNLSIMFSEWDGLKMDNPYNFPVFACKLKAGNKNRTEESFQSMHKCPGNCDICKATKRGCPYGESTYADEH